LADVGNIKKSPIFNPKTGFGGDGASPYRCIADGPFVNLTLRFNADLKPTQYCVMRNINDVPFCGASQFSLDICLKMKTFIDAWHCMEAFPHSAGHAGVGGVVCLASHTVYGNSIY